MDNNEKLISRETPEVDDSVKAFITQWIDEIKCAEDHWKDVYKRMREDMKMVRKGGDWQGAEGEKYCANLAHRHVQQKVAALYAKNPKVVARQRERIWFTAWDGTTESAQQAMQAMQVDPTDINALAVLTDIKETKAKIDMNRRLGKTVEILCNYYLSEQKPSFKTQCKQMIRRVETTGVGYIKIGFQRIMDKSADLQAKIFDLSNQIAEAERMAADMADGEIPEGSAEVENMRSTLQALQEQDDLIVREGLTFDFPKSTAVIPDYRCTNIKEFIGAEYIAEKFHFSKEDVRKYYHVDLGTKFTEYNEAGEKKKPKKNKRPMTLVYQVWDIRNGKTFTICDGYPDYLEAPHAPELKMERFHPYFALTFNDLEDEEADGAYPPSSVRLIRPMIMEYNRARESVREHRVANRPAYGVSSGVLEDDDVDKLGNHIAHEVLIFNTAPGEDITKMVMALPKIPIDPAIYDVEYVFTDVQRVTGNQEANFGGTSGATATEAGIAEGTRVSSISSSVDDLDDLLSEIASCSGQILLQELSEETVKRIVGPGAIWPQLSRQEAMEEVYLQIVAGSSGRPNKAAELANFERLAPTLIQIPGIRPRWLAEQAIQRMDDRLDLSEAIVDGLPSMIAMNAAMQPATGNAMTDPNQQGAQGAANAPAPDQPAGGAQPAFPQAQVH